MRSRTHPYHVTLIADLEGAAAYALRRSTEGWRLEDTIRIEYQPEALFENPVIDTLKQWVRARNLRQATNSIHFVGQGTIVQVLRMPPTRARDRAAAVRTRLTSFAGGRPLYVAHRLLPAPRQEKQIELIAAGVDAVACRALCAACEDAGLRVRYAGALAADVGPQATAGRLLQMIVTERTTTLQAFDDGRLVLCREVLIGRRDLTAALRRPILTDTGPLTLDEAQARRLLHEVGIPWERDDEPFEPGVRGSQLWPLLAPVLQRYQNEIEQTLAHRRLQPARPAALLALSIPPVPALDVALAADLELSTPDDPPAGFDWLVFNARTRSRDRALDLRPLPRRMVDRLARPAAAAALISAVLLAVQSHRPRSAAARTEALVTSARQLDEQLRYTTALCKALERQLQQGLAKLERRKKLAEKLPPTIHAREISKFLFATLPAAVVLDHVHVEVEPSSVVAQLRAHYQGEASAGLVANDWARTLSRRPGVISAEVARVTGSGQRKPATIVLRVHLSGGTQ